MHHIFILDKNETISYAASELSKYLTKITSSKDKESFKVKHQERYDKDLKGIWLVLGDDIKLSFDVKDPKSDDGIYISIKDGSGVIAGSNNRSILLGVYKFLNKLGCRWLRPSLDGEILVSKQLDEMNVSLKETPSFRHRGIVIEGANKYDNVLDMIEWMPKVGYNSYFIQFMYAYSFFKQWYSHTNNPLKEPEHFDDNMAEEFTAKLIKELKKRDLIFHSVGHGWTCEAIGVEGRGWDAEDHQLPPEIQKCVAMINGKRELYGNIPINTNLCYSSPIVQERFANSVVKYALENKAADMIHVWVADAFNNHCECDKCKELTPTDWYVEVLNLIDEKLTQENLPSKIAFLLYFELLWTPVKTRLKNPERFVMMFAPISRSFTTSYEDVDESDVDKVKVPAADLNKIKLPNSITSYMKFLRNWQKVFKGDSFDFDYHLGRAHYGDPGYYDISKLISKDIKALPKLGLNGLMSCQQQRSFFPTGLPNYVMAETLWDIDADFDDIAKDYLSHMFGEDYQKCKKYLSDISSKFNIDYWHLERGGINLDAAHKLKDINQLVDDFALVVNTNMENSSHNASRKVSWGYLHYHLEAVKLFASAIKAKASGDTALANNYWTKFTRYIQENEDNIQKVFDVFRIQEVGMNYLGFKSTK